MFMKRLKRKGLRGTGLWLLFLAILTLVLGALGSALDGPKSISMIVLGVGFGLFTAWLTWSSTGQGAPTFSKIRVFNFTDVPVESAKTERSDPPIPASPPPPPPPQLDEVPPASEKLLEAPVGMPFYTDVKGMLTTIRILGAEHSFSHTIQGGDYGTDFVMFQQIIIVPGAQPQTFQAHSTLFHLADTDEPELRWSADTFNLG